MSPSQKSDIPLAKLNYWLVFQNEESFGLESKDSYLFGGLTSDNGSRIYESLKDLKVGDICLHRNGAYVIAVSKVTKTSIERKRPEPLKEKEKREEIGYFVEAKYTLLPKEVPINAIPQNIRKKHQGEPKKVSFDRNGNLVTQTYLTKLDKITISKLLSKFRKIFPDWAV